MSDNIAKELEEQSEEIIAEAQEALNNEADDKASSPSEGEVEERIVIFEEALEAILFAAGHPISYATLARVFDMTPGKIKDKVFEYSLKYNDPAIPRGVILLTYGDSCQLCTKKYYLAEIREALGIRKNGTLSTSSMEALAIVAYNQPVTRIFVDTLRRADSSYAMNNLIDRGLIEAKGRLDAPGRPMLYGTTSDFLRVFGLKDLSELPSTSEDITDMFAKGRNVDEESEESAVQEQMEFPELDENAEVKADRDGESSEAATDGEYGYDVDRSEEKTIHSKDDLSNNEDGEDDEFNADDDVIFDEADEDSSEE